MDNSRPRPLRRLVRFLTAAVCVGAGSLIVAPTVAFAEEDAALTVSDSGTSFVITPVYWTILTGLAIPFVVALFTKAATSTKTKAVLAIVLAAVATIIERASFADGTGVIDSAILLDALLVFGPQVLSYLGFWQPVVRVNERVAPNFGI